MLVPFLNPGSEGLWTPRSRLLSILGLEQSSSSRSKSKRLDGGQFSLLGAGHLVAMTFLRRTSRLWQLLTDKQQATSCQKLKITSGTKHTRAHTTSKLYFYLNEQ